MTAKQAPRRFLPLARHHFVAGPYPVPDVGIRSGTVVDKHHGRVVVAGFTRADLLARLRSETLRFASRVDADSFSTV